MPCWCPACRTARISAPIAVVIPCHDYGDYLAEAIESVLQQTVQPAEIVVVLDRCSDHSAGVAVQYASCGVRALTIGAGDVYLARRAGLLATSAPWVCFLDADDILTPTYIEQALPHCGNPRVGIVTGAAQEIGASNDIWDPVCTDIQQENCCVSPSLVRRQALEQSAAFESLEPLGRLGQDWYVWKRIASCGWRIAKSSGWYYYRRHARNATLRSPQRWDRWGDGREPRGEGRADKTRALFLTPTLTIGGVFRHWLQLAKHCRGIAWSGILVADGGQVQEAAARQAEQFAPIFGGRPHALEHSPRVLRSGRAVDHLDRLIEQSDVIYAWASTAELLAAANRRLPVLYAIHGVGEWSRRFAHDCAEWSDRIVGVAEASALCLPEHARDRCVVIPNAADPADLVPRRSREEIRRQWGIGDCLAVGFVGRWSNETRPMALAQAVQALGPEAVAVYCGPQMADGAAGVPAKERQQAQKLTGGRVVWTSASGGRQPLGAISGDDAELTIGDVYQALDVLLLPSREEGFPLVVAEAWHAGLPVVATQVGALVEIARDYGELFVPIARQASGEVMAQAIRRATSAGFRPQVLHAQQIARERFTASRMAAAWALEFRATLRVKALEATIETLQAARHAHASRLQRPGK